MVEAPTRIIEGGRVTLPAHLRRELDLKKGDYVKIDVEPLEGEPDG